MKLRIVWFPWEQQYSIWDENYNLIKEWFDSKEDALQFIELIKNPQNENLQDNSKQYEGVFSW